MNGSLVTAKNPIGILQLTSDLWQSQGSSVIITTLFLGFPAHNSHPFPLPCIFIIHLAYKLPFSTLHSVIAITIQKKRKKNTTLANIIADNANLPSLFSSGQIINFRKHNWVKYQKAEIFPMVMGISYEDIGITIAWKMPMAKYSSRYNVGSSCNITQQASSNLGQSRSRRL